MDSAVHMEPPDNIGDGQLRARQVLAYSIEPANLKKGAGRLMVYVISVRLRYSCCMTPRETYSP